MEVRLSKLFVLQTTDGKYLYETCSTWGPSYLSGPLSEATLFGDSESYEISRVRKIWGGPLKLVRVTSRSFVTTGDADIYDKLERLALRLKDLINKEGYDLRQRLVADTHTEPAEVNDLLRAVAVISDDDWEFLREKEENNGKY